MWALKPEFKQGLSGELVNGVNDSTAGQSRVKKEEGPGQVQSAGDDGQFRVKREEGVEEQNVGDDDDDDDDDDEDDDEGMEFVS